MESKSVLYKASSCKGMLLCKNNQASHHVIFLLPLNPSVASLKDNPLRREDALRLYFQEVLTIPDRQYR